MGIGEHYEPSELEHKNMTPPLPKEIKDAFDGANVRTDAEESNQYQRTLGANILWSLLTSRAAGEFDERAATDEYTKCYVGDGKDWLRLARWQHAQTQALIVAKDTRIKELERELLSTRIDRDAVRSEHSLLRIEHSDLKRQLAEAKREAQDYKELAQSFDDDLNDAADRFPDGSLKP